MLIPGVGADGHGEEQCAAARSCDQGCEQEDQPPVMAGEPAVVEPCRRASCSFFRYSPREEEEGEEEEEDSRLLAVVRTEEDTEATAAGTFIRTEIGARSRRLSDPVMMMMMMMIMVMIT